MYSALFAKTAKQLCVYFLKENKVFVVSFWMSLVITEYMYHVYSTVLAKNRTALLDIYIFPKRQQSVCCNFLDVLTHY